MENSENFLFVCKALNGGERKQQTVLWFGIIKAKSANVSSTANVLNYINRRHAALKQNTRGKTEIRWKHQPCSLSLSLSLYACRVRTLHNESNHGTWKSLSQLQSPLT